MNKSNYSKILKKVPTPTIFFKKVPILPLF